MLFGLNFLYYVNMKDVGNTTQPVHGRGAQLNPPNPFLRQHLVTEHIEGLDEELELDRRTEFFSENAKKIINRVDSPDIPSNFSMNPYQGCEHGCVYCYARNTHTYWGHSAGLDFEQKIIFKPEAPELLKRELSRKTWKPSAIMLSGNTDCYQPAERKLRITRGMLEVLLNFRHPVGIITKNRLLLRDLDLLQELAKHRLVHVYLSVTTLDEKLRRLLEPRTVTGMQRIDTVRKLREAGIPAGVMIAPVIPSLNSQEIPDIIQHAADAGALGAGMAFIRLNGEVSTIFCDWIQKHFPDRAEKVLNQIRACHGGSLSDVRFNTRMKGEGQIAESIKQLFRNSVRRFLSGREFEPFNLASFRIPAVQATGQLSFVF